tara:strand:- start:5243 stop:5614 length:372 start_codon:yes stop_codon:yes gene_type:complete
MSEYSGLTFDWDDVSIDDGIVQAELEWLCEEFGEDYVWYRQSSSKTGLHVLIGQIELHPITLDFNIVPLKMGVEKQLEYRENTQIECRGRFFSDLFRKKMGLRTSRIFSTKNGRDVGKWKRFK